MKNLTLIAAMLVLGLTLGCQRLDTSAAATATDEAPPKVRVLVVTGGHPFDRDPFFAMFDRMENIEWEGFEMVEASDLFWRIVDWDYDAVVFYNMTSEIQDYSMAHFEALMEMGVGMVPMHHSTLSWTARPEIKEIFGVDFPQAGPFGFHIGERYTYDIIDPNHPITHGMEPFEVIDESYTNYYGDGHPGNHVLITTDHTPADSELVWTRFNRNARICNIQGGHDALMFNNENFVNLIERSILWTTGRLPRELGGETLTHSTLFRETARQAELASLKTFEEGGYRWASARLEMRMRAQLAATGESEIVGQVAGLLDDPETTDAARRYIFRMLAHACTDEIVEPVMPFLTDPTHSHMARFALMPIEGRKATAALLWGLKETEGAMRLGMIETLGLRGDARASRALVRLLKNGDVATREAAASALGLIADPRAVNALVDRFEAEPSLAAGPLVRAGQTALANDNAELAEKAFEALMESDAPTERAPALIGLAKLRGGAMLDELQVAIKSNETERRAALAALRGIEGKAAVEILNTAFGMVEGEARAQVVTALADRGAADSAVIFRRALIDDAEAVRMAGIDALEKLGGPEDLQALLALRTEANGDERDAVSQALARMGGKATDAALLALVESSGDPEAKGGLLEILAARRDQDAMALFLASATADDRALARSAWLAIGETASVDQLPELLELMMQLEGNSARSAATRSLRALINRVHRPTRSLTAISAAMTRADDEDMVALVQLAGNIKTPASADLIASLGSHPEVDVRLAAARALSTWPTFDPAATLIKLGRSDADKRVRGVALSGYMDLLRLPNTRSEGENLKIYAELVDLAEFPEVRRKAFEGIVSIPQVQSLDLIMKFVEGEALREEALEALFSLASELMPHDPEAVAGVMSRVAGMNLGSDVTETARSIINDAANFNEGLLAYWGFGRDSESWVAENQTEFENHGGILEVTSTGTDPFFSTPVEIEGPEVRLQFRMRYTGDGPLQLFWVTDENPAWGDVDMTITRNLDPTRNQWQTYEIPMRIEGKMLRLRIDPLVSEGVVMFDWIRVIEPASPLAMN